MYGLDPGVALGSTRVYRSVWRDPQTSSFYLPGCPQRAATLDSSCAHTHGAFTFFHIWFLSNQIFQYCHLDFD